MSRYTVKQLAQLAGVSVRTLHHYDAIGLLKPAVTGKNGYRYYGPEELLRLQQILIHREMEIPLAGIATLLAAQGPDRIATLRQQRDELKARASRYAGMVRTIERTIARLNGEEDMTDKDLYAGIVSPEKQKDYEDWLKQKGWKTGTSAHPGGDDRAAQMAALKDIEGALVEQLKAGVGADDARLDPLIARHRAWVAQSWGRDCPPAAYAMLTQVYQHPDFVARYEALAPGFSDYLSTAMQAWAARQG